MRGHPNRLTKARLLNGAESRLHWGGNGRGPNRGRRSWRHAATGIAFCRLHVAVIRNTLRVTAAAVGTGDLRPPSVRVGRAAHRTLYLIVETGPSAARVELVDRAVERRTALFAQVNTAALQLAVFTREGGLGTFVDDDVFLEIGEFFFHILCFKSRDFSPVHRVVIGTDRD